MLQSGGVWEGEDVRLLGRNGHGMWLQSETCGLSLSHWCQRRLSINRPACRYRWVAFHDLDEYLTPRINPPVNWSTLFK